MIQSSDTTKRRIQNTVTAVEEVMANEKTVGTKGHDEVDAGGTNCKNTTPAKGV